MAGIHDLNNTVVAVLEAKPEVEDALAGLSAAGYDYEVLVGEEGREHLDPAGEEGLVAMVKRLIAAFGDEYRILQRLDDALAEGKTVVSVEAMPDEAKEAIGVLRQHGGHYIWKFGDWTFTRIGD